MATLGVMNKNQGQDTRVYGLHDHLFRRRVDLQREEVCLFILMSVNIVNIVNVVNIVNIVNVVHIVHIAHIAHIYRTYSGFQSLSSETQVTLWCWTLDQL